LRNLRGISRCIAFFSAGPMTTAAYDSYSIPNFFDVHNPSGPLDDDDVPSAPPPSSIDDSPPATDACCDIEPRSVGGSAYAGSTRGATHTSSIVTPPDGIAGSMSRGADAGRAGRAVAGSTFGAGSIIICRFR
jgi:hypothetical protein